MRLRDLLWCTQQKADRDAVGSAERIVNANSVVNSQGVRVTIGLADWPVYYRRRRTSEHFWGKGGVRNL